MPTMVALQETNAVPEPDTLAGVIAPHVRPGGTVSVRATVPVNPPNAVMVIVDVVEEPAGADAGEVAEIAKSRKLKVAVAV